MRTLQKMSSESPMRSPSGMTPHSPWHSPVPYLFGGLAAMLGLIAFALLILACSYWKLSGYLENSDDAERDPERGDEKGGDGIKIPTVFEEKIVVIMAGDEKPTFIATPISSKASSFNDDKKKNDSEEKSEKPKEETAHQEQQQHQEETEQNRVTSQSQSQTQSQETQNQNQNQNQ